MDNRVSQSRDEDEAVMFPPPYCPRCRGLMYPVSYGELGDSQNTQPLRAWNCILCGEMIDPVIVANRRKRSPVTMEKRRGKKGSGGESAIGFATRLRVPMHWCAKETESNVRS